MGKKSKLTFYERNEKLIKSDVDLTDAEFDTSDWLNDPDDDGDSEGIPPSVTHVRVFNPDKGEFVIMPIDEGLEYFKQRTLIKWYHNKEKGDD